MPPLSPLSQDAQKAQKSQEHRLPPCSGRDHKEEPDQRPATQSPQQLAGRVQARGQEQRRRCLRSSQRRRLLQACLSPYSRSPGPGRQLIFFLDPGEAQGLRDSRRCRQVPARFQGPVPEQELRPALLTPQEREPAQALPQLLPQALMPVKEPVRLMLRGQLRQERRRRRRPRSSGRRRRGASRSCQSPRARRERT